MPFLAAIAFDPAIRGVLVVMVGVVVLFGSIYLILATNTGIRGGFLIAMAGLAGWLFSMGIFWWIYGIGMIGAAPSWMEREVNFDRNAVAITEQLNELPPSDELTSPTELLEAFEDENPDIRAQIESTEGEGFEPKSLTQVVTLVPELKSELDEDLNGWRILPESDSRRGEAVAATDATLSNNAVFGTETSPSNYTVKDVFFFGGKAAAEPDPDAGLLKKAWNRVVSAVQVKNPTQFAAITLQRNIETTVAPGEAPPPAQIDESASTITVVLERNLGNKRAIPALFTFFTGIAFFVFCWMLHTRDLKAAAMRANWDPSAEAA